MRSIRKRNTLYRGIVFGGFALVCCIIFISSSGFAKTSAHERNDQVVVQEEIIAYKPVATTQVYEIQSGDTILAILQLEAGIVYEDAVVVLEQINEVFDSTKIRAGNSITMTLLDGKLDSILYDISKEEELVITRLSDGFSVVRQDIVYETEEVFVSGVIEDSLYQSALAVGMTDRMIMELATVFAWDVDFTSSLREGDQFSLFYENRYRNGEFAGTGDLIAAKFVNSGNEFFTYLVKDEDGKNKYYNEDGQATEKMFLKTPLNYKRISSGFSLNRKHPILGTFRTHRAIDFAADTGTPVETVADGTVVFAGWSGAYGNYIKIRHGGGFETAYAHLSKMYVSKGATVRQGDVIGAVGSTGRSTGPHLHYEMYKDGELVHPLETKTPAGEPISDEARPLLEAVVAQYKPQL